MAVITTCTAQQQVSALPCLDCLSKLELLAIIVKILATGRYNLSTQLNTLMSDAACFRELSEKQMLQGLTAALYTEFGLTESVEQLRADVKCLLCAGDHDLKAMAAFLFCKGTVTPE